MIEAESHTGRFLQNVRTQPEARRTSILISVGVVILSFGLTYGVGYGHFLGLCFVAIVLMAWQGGWVVGLATGIAIPILALPIPVALGVPRGAVTMDMLTFAFMTIVCGWSVGLMGTLFGQVATQRTELKLLYGILPICSHCHRIRGDDDEWTKLESYIHEHSEARFSHGVCPTCLGEHYPASSDPLRA